MGQQAKPFEVFVQVHRPESVEGDGQWAASTINTSTKGMFAWGDSMEAAVEELCRVVFDYVTGPTSKYKTAAEFTGVRAAVVYDFEPTRTGTA